MPAGTKGDEAFFVTRRRTKIQIQEDSILHLHQTPNQQRRVLLSPVGMSARAALGRNQKQIRNRYLLLSASIHRFLTPLHRKPTTLLSAPYTMSSSSLKQHLAEAPEDFGLQITLECESDKCQLEFVPDQHLEIIHPNAYGPLALTNLERLGGGESGVRVFRGNHPQLGPLVMKHGGYKDTKELFALATIAKEMQRRNPEARADMKWRFCW